MLSRTRSPAADKSEQTRPSHFLALDDVNLEVKRGEVLGIIGRNGAGKSTLLKVLSRITEPTSGRVEIEGRIGSLLEVGTGFHPELTGRENVFLNGAILGMRRNEIAAKFDQIVAFAEVEKFLDTQVKHYSSGMYMRLAFAVAAHLEPEILIVDEVLAVGDMQFQRKCLGRMGEVSREGRTVLFVSHNMGAIENLCSSSVLLEHGKAVAVGPTRGIVERYLHDILPAARDGMQLGSRTDRSGNGSVRLTSFHIEDENGHRLSIAYSGAAVIFVFGFAAPHPEQVRNVDIGLSVHGALEQTLFVLYSSYVNDVIPTIPARGQFRCAIPNLRLAAGRYSVGARVVVAGDEADWPAHGVGEITVEAGNFFGTGSPGHGPDAPMLQEGRWSVQ